jgi:hypothetical protein
MRVLAQRATSTPAMQVARCSSFVASRRPAANPAARPAASGRVAVRTLALFGGAKAATPASIYDIKIKVRTEPLSPPRHSSNNNRFCRPPGAPAPARPAPAPAPPPPELQLAWRSPSWS